jgi:hypothetical protein
VDEALQHMESWAEKGSMEERAAAAVRKELPQRIGIARSRALTRRPSHRHRRLR